MKYEPQVIDPVEFLTRVNKQIMDLTKKEIAREQPNPIRCNALYEANDIVFSVMQSMLNETKKKLEK